MKEDPFDKSGRVHCVIVILFHRSSQCETVSKKVRSAICTERFFGSGKFEIQNDPTNELFSFQ